MQDSPGIWVLVSTWEIQKELYAPWLQPSPALVVKAMWRQNNSLASILLLSLSNKYILKKKKKAAYILHEIFLMMC